MTATSSWTTKLWTWGSDPQGMQESVEGTPAPTPVMLSPEPTTLAHAATPVHAASPPPLPKFVSPPPNTEDCLDIDADDIEPR
jgi:hypothetical protein